MLKCIYVILLVLISYFSMAQTKYYVNDASLTGDIYTTAVGNDANTGQSAASPRATVASILSSYTLTGGDTILIDVGT